MKYRIDALLRFFPLAYLSSTLRRREYRTELSSAIPARGFDFKIKEQVPTMRKTTSVLFSYAVAKTQFFKKLRTKLTLTPSSESTASSHDSMQFPHTRGTQLPACKNFIQIHKIFIRLRGLKLSRKLSIDCSRRELWIKIN